MPEAETTVLGFDYGKRWTGVAVGQTLTRQATPLRAIRSDDWASFGRLIAEWQPARLVVGMPLNMRGETQAMTAAARRFGNRLSGRFGIAVDFVDERLTTREAWQLLERDGERRSKPEIDSLSAMLITESWLNDYASG
ncbi:MAG: Holliday junction resolvase RuvX [Gammaproteobacteria bacterium]|nr:Holliday junction resolvase RuvX [Gammaproteobacteria bacterium]